MASTASTVKGIEREILVDLYRRMFLVRRCELQLAKSHQQGLVHGACHTCVGQEAVPVGVCAHLNSSDVVFSTHRGHGHALAKGVPPKELIAELYGRATGCSRGRGGSMHLFAPEVGLMGTSGIVGPCILQATGAAYSFKLLRTQRVAVAFFGDGAVNNGAFHEGLNLASIWKLPVLFVCENNQYATEVPFRYSGGNPHVANRGAAYGLPSIEVDGNDVLAVYQAALEAVDRARHGGGATLIECLTYRVRPHAEGMVDFTYRSPEEVESWKQRCPIRRLHGVLLGSDDDSAAAEANELDALEDEITAVVNQAHQHAQASPYPVPESATSHVYCESNSASSENAPAQRTPVFVEPASGGREMSFSEAMLAALTHAMEHDPTIFVLGEGIGERGGNFNTTTKLYARFGPERLRDTPICERGFVGLSTGAAMTGTRPVIDFMFADFILDAMGEILNQIAKVQYMSNGRLKMPVVLRGCFGIGHSAATHHSGSYYPLYAHFPGLRVVVPSRPHDAKGLFAHALKSRDPVIFLEHRELLTIRGNVPKGHYEIPFGQAAILHAGTDVTVVALAQMVYRVLEAASILDEENISIEVIDPRTVAPLDIATIACSVAKTGRLITVDETFLPFGLGAEVTAQIVEHCFDDLDAPVRRLHGSHTPTPYSPVLEKAVVPQVDDIVRAIRELAAE